MPHSDAAVWVVVSDNTVTTPYSQLGAYAAQQLGFRVSLFSPGAGPSAIMDGLPFPCAEERLEGRIGTSRFLRSFLSLWRRANRERVHALILTGQSWCRYAVLIKLLPRCFRLIYQSYDFYDPRKFPIHFCMEGLLVRTADSHWNGESNRLRYLASFWRLSESAIVFPPRLPSAWKVPAAAADDRLSQLPSGTCILVQHGGYSELRQTRNFLAALKECRAAVHALFLGEEPGGTVDQTAAELGIASQVTTIGRLSFGAMLALSAHAHAGVLLYRHSDYGNYFQNPGRLTEYLIGGHCLLVSNSIVFDPFVDRWKIAVRCDADSPQSIASAIEELAAMAVRPESREKVRNVFAKDACLEASLDWDALRRVIGAA